MVLLTLTEPYFLPLHLCSPLLLGIMIPKIRAVHMTLGLNASRPKNLLRIKKMCSTGMLQYMHVCLVRTMTGTLSLANQRC